MDYHDWIHPLHYEPSEKEIELFRKVLARHPALITRSQYLDIEYWLNNRSFLGDKLVHEALPPHLQPLLQGLKAIFEVPDFVVAAIEQAAEQIKAYGEEVARARVRGLAVPPPPPDLDFLAPAPSPPPTSPSQPLAFSQALQAQLEKLSSAAGQPDQSGLPSGASAGEGGSGEASPSRKKEPAEGPNVSGTPAAASSPSRGLAVQRTAGTVDQMMSSSFSSLGLVSDDYNQIEADAIAKLRTRSVASGQSSPTPRTTLRSSPGRPRTLFKDLMGKGKQKEQEQEQEQEESLPQTTSCQSRHLPLLFRSSLPVSSDPR